jgi:hypothetical protein
LTKPFCFWQNDRRVLKRPTYSFIDICNYDDTLFVPETSQFLYVISAYLEIGTAQAVRVTNKGLSGDRLLKADAMQQV